MVSYGQYQSPQQAYTRWLSERGGDTLSSYIQQLLTARGRRQAALAPLFGFGISQEIGGQGRDFAPFYSQPPPTWQDLQIRLRETQQALAGGTQQTPYQAALAAAYESPENQLEALQASLTAQVPATLRSGFSRQLARRFSRQQATRPEQRFFDYASQAGLF